MTLPSQPPPTLITGLVLAGGQSRRMGQDKALLCWRGEALLTRTCRLALGLGDRLWVITSRPDTYRPHLPPGCGILLEPPIAPGARSPGPLLALARGLAAVETDWALLLACDLPCLRAVDLQRAAADLAGLPAAVAAYLPRAVLSQTAGPEPAVSQPGPIAPQPGSPCAASIAGAAWPPSSGQWRGESDRCKPGCGSSR
ncbi:MAG: NTP transferase domain-containing protein, partial [Synechococcales cyanobacterium RM1_1_8]|nr:NTP transferase domain-containing protein [Synechococcales cyanobacterium RM1_1_8]